MTKTIRGTVHGRRIDFDDDLGIPDGQQVEVQVRAVPEVRKWGEGILRTAGALADDPHWDAIMDEIHEARKVERRPQSEGE
jgi:hypothetical protein